MASSFERIRRVISDILGLGHVPRSRVCGLSLTSPYSYSFPWAQLRLQYIGTGEEVVIQVGVDLDVYSVASNDTDLAGKSLRPTTTFALSKNRPIPRATPRLGVSEAVVESSARKQEIGRRAVEMFALVAMVSVLLCL